MNRIVPVFLKHKGLRGGLIFLGILSGGCFLLSRNAVYDFLELNFTSGIAYLAARFLQGLGMNVHVSGTCIAGHGLAVDIRYGCNAVYEIMIFSAAVVGYPLKIKDRMNGVVLGAVFIYALNLLRVIGLFLTGVYFPEVFEVLHEHIAQSLFIFFLVVSWFFWVARCTRKVPAK